MDTHKQRYVRITRRFAAATASLMDEPSQALAELLHRRLIETIVAECAPQVTSDWPPQRLAQAVTALGDYGVELRVEDGIAVAEACFCGSDGCGHPERLLAALLESMTVASH